MTAKRNCALVSKSIENNHISSQVLSTWKAVRGDDRCELAEQKTRMTLYKIVVQIKRSKIMSFFVSLVLLGLFCHNHLICRRPADVVFIYLQ